LQVVVLGQQVCNKHPKKLNQKAKKYLLEDHAEETAAM
jgi:hypothetical protein